MDDFIAICMSTNWLVQKLIKMCTKYNRAYKKFNQKKLLMDKHLSQNAWFWITWNWNTQAAAVGINWQEMESSLRWVKIWHFFMHMCFGTLCTSIEQKFAPIFAKFNFQQTTQFCFFICDSTKTQEIQQIKPSYQVLHAHYYCVPRLVWLIVSPSVSKSPIKK